MATFQKALFTILGAVIAIVSPFVRDVYHALNSPTPDFSGVRSDAMNSLEGLIIAAVLIGVILWGSHLIDKGENRKRDKKKANEIGFWSKWLSNWVLIRTIIIKNLNPDLIDADGDGKEDKAESDSNHNL